MCFKEKYYICKNFELNCFNSYNINIFEINKNVVNYQYFNNTLEMYVLLPKIMIKKN